MTIAELGARRGDPSLEFRRAAEAAAREGGWYGTTPLPHRCRGMRPALEKRSTSGARSGATSAASSDTCATPRALIETVGARWPFSAMPMLAKGG